MMSAHAFPACSAVIESIWSQKRCDDRVPSSTCGRQRRKLVPANPFVTVDRPGVGRLMRIAVEEGQAANPALHLGICGEHGGDPVSVVFCHQIGLDYVSCSPFRVETARLAAGQAAIGEAESASK